MEISGRNVVITGASQGIGLRLAEEFAKHGANLLLVARSQDKLETLASRLGGKYLVADLVVGADVDSLIPKALAALGHIDVLVNNAGVDTNDAFVHIPRNDLRSLARLNFEAPLMLSRDVLPHMIARGTGHIVQLSSLAGAIPFPGLAAYAGSKAGLTNFTESLRLELGGTGVGLTIVAPGPVDTAMWDRIEEAEIWPAPALKRFRALQFLPKVDPSKLAADIVAAVESNKRFVRPVNRFFAYHQLNNAPRRMVEGAMVGVKMAPLRPLDEVTNQVSNQVGSHSGNQVVEGNSVGAGSAAGSQTLSSIGPLTGPLRPSQIEFPGKIWKVDNQLSKRWPLFTRGNIGEVFPEVVLPLTWDVFGLAAERGWRAAFVKMGLLQSGDISADEQMVILSVIGGYGYINASFVRMLGVRAPGGTVDQIDLQFFGESDAPKYKPRDGDKNLKASAALGKTVFRLLGAKEVPGLLEDKAEARAYVNRNPGATASDSALLAYLADLEPLFEKLFARHIENTFSVALVSGALSDLCLKAKKGNLLVSILGGIGDVESAAPSAALWRLAQSANATPAVSEAFGAGPSGLLERLGTQSDKPEIKAWMQSFERFIEEFGSRGPNEWDIGSDPWAFRPELALSAIDRMRSADQSHDPASQTQQLTARREAAVAEIRAALNPVDRIMFAKALRSTTLYSQARERSKTTIIAAIHGARIAQRELGQRVTQRGGPTQRWQTNLYTRDELISALIDPAPLAPVIEERAQLYSRLASLIPPFIVDGTVPALDTWESRQSKGVTVKAGDKLHGIAGCPGIARGRACIVLDPADPRDLGPGDVLVAPITDPSWTPLFLAAEAVVVDVGATMSHAVIVSRELGIPCVVSAVGATRTIPDGALIEVDGNTGVVTILELPVS